MNPSQYDPRYGGPPHQGYGFPPPSPNPYPGYGYAYQGTGPPPNAPGVTASFVCGVLSLLLCSPLGLVAIIWGGVAKSRIRDSGGYYQGKGYATMAQVLGGIGLTVMTILIFVFAANFKQSPPGFTAQEPVPPPAAAPGEVAPPPQSLSSGDKEACRYYFDHVGDAMRDPTGVYTKVRDMASGPVKPAAQRVLDAQERVNAVTRGETGGNDAFSVGEELGNASAAFGEECGKAISQ